MKSESTGWSSSLLALALAFVLALLPLTNWVDGALGLPASKFSEVTFFVAFVLIWLTLRARRFWLELPNSRRQGGAVSFAYSQLTRALVFAAVVGGGIALFMSLMGDWLRQGGIWELLITELLIVGVLLKAASRAADAAGDPIWNGARIEKTHAPDGAALLALNEPFVVGRSRADARISMVIFAALSAVCLLAYSFVYIAARSAGTAAPAPTWAFIGFILLLFSLLCWWECAPLGEVNASQIRPRFGRSFNWWDVAQVEETRVSRFLEGNELRVIFRDAQGAALWQIPIDKLESGEKRELWRLFPQTTTANSELVA